jgi:hypothetical protein
MTKYMVSKYSKNCYSCGQARGKLLIVKFNAEIAKFDIGTSDVYIDCCNCGRRALHKINTWWGGTFTNEDVVYEDTAKKRKIKVSSLLDITNKLLNERVLELEKEVVEERREFDSKLLMLKSAKKALKESNKRKKKNG